MPGTGEIGLHSVQYAGMMFKGRCLERLDNALCQLTRYSPSAGVPKSSHWCASPSKLPPKQQYEPALWKLFFDERVITQLFLIIALENP
jgi:hypothetical protein